MPQQDKQSNPLQVLKAKQLDLTPEALAEILAPLAVIIGFIEWRYRGLHTCVRRIEKRLDKHLDK